MDKAALLNIEPFRPMLAPVTANSVAGCASPSRRRESVMKHSGAFFVPVMSVMADRVGSPSGLPVTPTGLAHPARFATIICVQAGGGDSSTIRSLAPMNTQHSSCTLPSVLSFEGVELKIIDRDGQPWITSGDLGRALSYKRGGDQVATIYRQHAHEFCESMSQVIDCRDLPEYTLEAPESAQTAESAVSGNLARKVRVFSPRGAHLIAMFARTAKAAAFRRWVLDVLEGLAVSAAQPVVENPLDSLRLTRVLFTLDGYGRPQAMAVPDDACMMRVADVPALMADTAAATRAEVEAVALAALQRVYEESGTHGLRNLLATLDENYLLVLESELIYSLYGSPTVWNAAKRGGKHA